MSYVDDTVRQFGKMMGFSGLSLGEDGRMALAFERRGTLLVEKAGGEVLVSLSREVPAHRPGVLEKAMALCHYASGLPLMVNPALDKNRRLFFACRMPEREFSVPALERALEVLTHLQDQAAEGTP